MRVRRHVDDRVGATGTHASPRKPQYRDSARPTRCVPCLVGVHRRAGNTCGALPRIHIRGFP
jgi:hypothetical protein